jgi:hypothetical protein
MNKMMKNIKDCCSYYKNLNILITVGVVAILTVVFIFRRRNHKARNAF